VQFRVSVEENVGKKWKFKQAFEGYWLATSNDNSYASSGAISVPAHLGASRNIGSVLDLVPNTPRLRGANLFLGIAEYRLNRFDLAIGSLTKESALDPSSGNAWMWLGVAQLAAGHADEAAGSLDRAAKLDPKNTNILYHRGQAHLLVSRDSYTRMFKEDPTS
jgi:tetratricopeptide (TPR) repeat protein